MRATGRSLASLSSLQGPGVELVPADMDDPKDLERLMDGVDRVLVNAPMDDHKESRERNIIQAMINTGKRPQIVLLTGGVDHDDLRRCWPPEQSCRTRPRRLWDLRQSWKATFPFKS